MDPLKLLSFCLSSTAVECHSPLFSVLKEWNKIKFSRSSHHLCRPQLLTFFHFTTCKSFTTGFLQRNICLPLRYLQHISTKLHVCEGIGLRSLRSHKNCSSDVMVSLVYCLDHRGAKGADPHPASLGYTTRTTLSTDDICRIRLSHWIDMTNLSHWSMSEEISFRLHRQTVAYGARTFLP